MNTNHSNIWGKKLMAALEKAPPENPDVITLDEDRLQNDLILIVHHLDDADEGIAENDLDYVRSSLRDIREVVERLSRSLSPELAANIAAARTMDEDEDEEETDADRTE